MSAIMCDDMHPQLGQATETPGVSPPWVYDIKDAACSEPLGLRLINVDDIRFTQSHINDSFSHEMRPVMEMVVELLSGSKHQREIPVLRVAWRDGAFWAIDNRRTFVYKHCRMGRACVEVQDWSKHKEYEMKWKGGNEMRDKSAGGRRVGLVQRLKDSAFPRSEVIELGMENNDISKLMDEDEQLQHDALVAAFAAKRLELMSFEDTICAKIREPWHFEANASDAGWMPATIWQAHVDGTFDAILLDGSVQTFRPRLFSERLRLRDSHSSAAVFPEVQSDLQLLSMVVPLGLPSRLQIAWCAICRKDVGGEPRKLRLHERQEHPERGRFPCSSCKRVFSCSDDLRKHSRSKQHLIPAAFGRHLGSSNYDEGDSGQENEIDDEVRQRQRDDQDVSSMSGCSQASLIKPSIKPGLEKSPVFIVDASEPSAARGAASTKCAICQHVCAAKDLPSHEESQHTRDEFECQTCQTKFSCSRSLRKHSRSKSHEILCTFMLDGERAELASRSSEKVGGYTELEKREENVSAAPVQDRDRLSFVIWSHSQFGIRLMERLGSITEETTSECTPSWADLVLEKWCGDGGRPYLYCPANQLWFWEDEAEQHGWCRELLHKDER